MPDARAALKVARPQAVGGYELRIPKAGLARQVPSGGRFTTGTDAPQGGSVEASNLHGATSAGTAALPKRSDSPKGDENHSLPRLPAAHSVDLAPRRPGTRGPMPFGWARKAS